MALGRAIILDRDKAI